MDFEWWVDLPGWLRLGIPLALLAVSTILFFSGTFWPWGWAFGFILLVFDSWVGSDNWA